MTDADNAKTEYKSLLEELVAENHFAPVDPLTEVTSAMYGLRLGITERAAYGRLEQMVQRGVLVKRKAKSDSGQIVMAYSKAK